MANFTAKYSEVKVLDSWILFLTGSFHVLRAPI